MKTPLQKTMWLWLVLLFVLSPSLYSASPLRAGAAVSDVTPTEFPVNMPGGFSANAATSAHDPLFSRALVLEKDGTALALVVVDNLGLSPDTVELAKKSASQRCGLASERVLIASTHTHTGPSSGANERSSAAQVRYRDRLVEGIASSIVNAHAVLRPAAVGSASYPLPEEVFNRRWFLKPGKMPPNPFGNLDQVKTNPGTSPDVLDHPAGPTDPDVSILSVQDEKRNPLAVFANYALHYVGGSPKGQISADYFGEFARLLPSRFRAPENFVAMMSNGASGDINNIPFTLSRAPREPFEQIRIVAQKAADAAWQAHRKIQRYSADVQIAMQEREVTVNYRKPSATDIENARRIVALKDPAQIAELPHLAQNYARNILAAAERPESLNVKIQALRIGDLAICGLPFEVFVEIGLELKKRSPFLHTVVVGLANGRFGYLPTAGHHELGGYETWLGTNLVQQDASDVLVKNLLEMLGQLH
jgi:neutral ceramidase